MQPSLSAMLTRRLVTTADAFDDWHQGDDPAGIRAQDRVVSARLDPVLTAGRRLAHYLKLMNVEAAAMAGVPLAGTNWIPGQEQI